MILFIGFARTHGRRASVCCRERDAIGELYARRRHVVRRCILWTHLVLAAREHRDPVRCLRPGRLLSFGGGCHVRIGAMHAVCVAVHIWYAPDRAMGMAQEVSRCRRYGKGRKYFERGKIAMAVGAGIAGLPPTVPLFTLGPSLQMKLPPMLIIVFAFRVLRFASCCFLGSIGAEDGKRWWAALYSAITEGTEWRARTQPGDTRFVYQELPTFNVR